MNIKIDERYELYVFPFFWITSFLSLEIQEGGMGCCNPYIPFFSGFEIDLQWTYCIIHIWGGVFDTDLKYPCFTSHDSKAEQTSIFWWNELSLVCHHCPCQFFTIIIYSFLPKFIGGKQGMHDAFLDEGKFQVCQYEGPPFSSREGNT